MTVTTPVALRAELPRQIEQVAARVAGGAHRITQGKLLTGIRDRAPRESVRSSPEHTGGPSEAVRIQRHTLLVCAAAAALSMAGCARYQEPPPSLKDVTVAPTVTEQPENPGKDVRDWCASRHLDRQQGKPPGGAETPEQIEEGNRVCGELYRYPGYLQR